MSTANPAAARESADIVTLVRDLITDRDLAPGDRLPAIRDLADQFGVKPGAVRDAFLAAQAQGLLKVLPRIGAIVQSAAEPRGTHAFAEQLSEDLSDDLRTGDQNLFHVLETREALELTMVAKAAQRRELSELYRLRQILADMAAIPLEVASPDYARLDVEFHLEIGRLSGNNVMTSLLRTLLLEVRPHLNRIRWSDNRRAATDDSHARIYSALAAGDADRAQHEMRDHIRAAYNGLLNELREPPAMNGGGRERSDS